MINLYICKMKKINAEFLLQLIFGIIAIALMLGGAIMFVASFFTSLPIFNAIYFMALGAILYTGVRIYFMLLEVASSINNSSTQVNKSKAPFDLLKSEVININEDTTPEQLEEIKKKFPAIADQLDKIIDTFIDETKKNNGYFSESVKNINNMTIKQLQEELNLAVENNEFEKAAEIRDILKKRIS